MITEKPEMIMRFNKYFHQFEVVKEKNLRPKDIVRLSRKDWKTIHDGNESVFVTEESSDDNNGDTTMIYRPLNSVMKTLDKETVDMINKFRKILYL
jgi:hypothetical protein